MNTNFDLHSFRVLSPSLASYSTSQVRITTTSLVFNITAAAELGYPEYVSCLASDDGRYMALQANPPMQLQDVAIPFWNDDTRKSIPLRAKSVVKALRRELAWDDKAARKTNGILFRKEGVLMFDLQRAVLASQKITKEISLSDFPQLSEIYATLRPRVLELGAGEYQSRDDEMVDNFIAC